MSTGRKIVTKNRKAYHEYSITDRYDAGLVLMGSEIKSIRGNRVNIADGFVQEKGRELWLMNVHIAPYLLSLQNSCQLEQKMSSGWRMGESNSRPRAC